MSRNRRNYDKITRTTNCKKKIFAGDFLIIYYDNHLLTFSAKSREAVLNFRTVLEIWCGCILYLVLILIFGFNKRFYDNHLLTFSAKSRGCIYNFRTVLEIWCGCILYLVLILIFGFNKRFYDNRLLIFCQFWSGSRNDCVELLNNFCQWIFFDISYRV
jgi:hypothetical protein